MKQCPQCNSSCEDNANVCTNCGYIFPPKGFESEFNNNSAPTNQFNANNQQPSFNQQGFNSQPGFNSNNMGAMPPKNNGMSVASLVLGICSAVFGCCYCLGFIPGVIAVILGFMSNSKIKKSGGTEKGKNFAITGIILGFLGIAFAIYFAVSFYANREMIFDMMNNIMKSYN